VGLQDNDTAPRHALLRVRVPRKLRRRMSLAQALVTSITITRCAVLVAAAAVTYTDPEQFPHLGVGLWWAAATVTTVGYGDVVPSSPGGRLIGGLLMFLGIASLALLTAIVASAIVVG
jgi:voltage-gated potassium channel